MEFMDCMLWCAPMEEMVPFALEAPLMWMFGRTVPFILERMWEALGKPGLCKTLFPFVFNCRLGVTFRFCFFFFTTQNYLHPMRWRKKKRNFFTPGGRISSCSVVKVSTLGPRHQ